MSVKRIYVEKKPPYDVEAQWVFKEIHDILLITNVTGVRLLNRYDVEGIDRALFDQCKPIVFMEPPLDIAYDVLPQVSGAVIACEYLPGQFDARAASCRECIQFVSQTANPTVHTAKIYLLDGKPTTQELHRIRQYLINPVESREADLGVKTTLALQVHIPETIKTLDGFRTLDDSGIAQLIKAYGLAMDEADLQFCQTYFRSESRDPTVTELRVIDTYWSDHCRHTTFLTVLDEVIIQKPAVEKAFRRYLDLRASVYDGECRPMHLMDIATIGAKALKRQGLLTHVDESEEINACSVKLDVQSGGTTEPWLLLFKNETHNHPTEIEPFGGAATCIGGAIRDPLSGRAYVYQAMRVTGAANPLKPVVETMQGKLPQRKLVTTAAAGFSAYGNQVGLATGLVDEFYHDGYAAKRLEIGAVVGAVPACHVRREHPLPGDLVILLGGRTGRDGCGGATGSSKSHDLVSVETCGAEVQKGNPVTERKLQRLFCDKRASLMIKRCNDFGAGGVCVAIGELADGLKINLDKIPKKYEGLDGTELAISESQERMAVLVSKEDAKAFIALALTENLEAAVVAEVTREPYLQMMWNGWCIVNLSRAFLGSNGAEKHAKAFVPDASLQNTPFEGVTLTEKYRSMVSDLNICSKKGLVERFDSTIGAGTVFMPFGGYRQLTPIQTMAAKLPVAGGETTTVSGMSYGFFPQTMAQSPFEGAYLSVTDSLAKLAAAGFDISCAALTFQEYFERMTDDPSRWGKPLAALLGALCAQLDFGVAAIGGKDSMSGSFENLNVPPTLVSFAVAAGLSGAVISPEFKAAGHCLRLLTGDPYDGSGLRDNYMTLYRMICDKKVVSAWAVGWGGIAEAVFKMGLGNRIGAHLFYGGDLFAQAFGSILIEMADGGADADGFGVHIGHTIEEHALHIDEEIIDFEPLETLYEEKLAGVFPYINKDTNAVKTASYTVPRSVIPAVRTHKPMAFIPVFPGTNCETDTAAALSRAGAEPNIFIIKNITPAAISEALREAARMISKSQMIVFPGGFSGGDEPDGSGKFINAFFRNTAVKDAVCDLMERRDGLILGICNGFQALIKLGLLPYGKITDTDAKSPTLTYNAIGRHQSMLVRTRIASNLSPWLQKTRVDEIHTLPISHGEGRFVADQGMLERLLTQGQIATQYVDLSGIPTMDIRHNPNGSAWAIEGITSPDGRVLGKMGHTERAGKDLYKNVDGNKFQPVFEGGVAYFS